MLIIGRSKQRNMNLMNV